MSSTQLSPERERYIAYQIHETLTDDTTMDSLPMSELQNRVEDPLAKRGLENDSVPQITHGHITTFINNTSAITRRSHNGDDVITGIRPELVGTAPDCFQQTTQNSSPVQPFTPDIESVADSDTESSTPVTDRTDSLGISPNRANVLEEHGFKTISDLAQTDAQTLLSQVPTFSRQTEATDIITNARMLSGDATSDIAQEAISAVTSFRQQTGGVAQSWEGDDTAICQPAGEPTDKHFNGLPILTHTGHPRIPSLDDLPPMFARPVGSSDPEEPTPDDAETDIELIARIQAQNNYAVNLIGHSGTGKSLLGEYIAAVRNQPLVTINMDGDVHTEDILGMHRLQTSTGRQISSDEAETMLDEATETGELPEQVTTVWKDGPVTRAYRYGWYLIINEINAAPAEVLLALFSMLERDDKLHLKGNDELIEGHEQFRLLTTMNPQDGGYHGTNELNTAFANRLIPHKVDFLPPKKEIELIDRIVNADAEPPVLTRPQIRDLCDLANKFRSHADQQRPGADALRPSPRDILQIAELYRGAPGPLRTYVYNYFEAQTIGHSRGTEQYTQFIRDTIQEEY